MTRKQKIIVSTTGIFLVLLILVGLTYAYFLTRIKGNTNEKSISVTTANLELKYDDIEDVVVGGENVEPGVTWTKKFSATNNGNKTIQSYGVILEKVVNTLDRSKDLVYTLKCTSNKGNACNGINDEKIFPNIATIIVTNSIEKDEVQSYELIVTYKEQNEDQSVDMNKKIYAKVNLVNPSTYGVFSSGYIANTLIDSAKNATETNDNIRTLYNDVPSTSPGNEISYAKYLTENGSGILSEKNLTIDVSIYSSYYWTYGTSYIVDENTGKFSLTDAMVSDKPYTEMYNDLVGKYLITNTAGENSNFTSTIKTPSEDLSYYLFKVISATESQVVVRGIRAQEKESEKLLTLSEDDYGISYYYRGNVIDNYVNFAGMCFRIVRIQGDGSVKIVLEDQNTTCNSELYTGEWAIEHGNFGFDKSDGEWAKMAYLNPVTEKEYSMVVNFENFQENKLSDFKKYLKSGDWCLNDKPYGVDDVELTEDQVLEYNNNGMFVYYDSSVRLRNEYKNYPMNICNGKILTNYSDGKDMYVGALTADEIVYAGGVDSINNRSYYLLNDFYQFNTKEFRFYSLSPILYTQNLFTFLLNTKKGSLNSNLSSLTYKRTNNIVFRPSVILSSNVKIVNGNGLISNPYEIGL